MRSCLHYTRPSEELDDSPIPAGLKGLGLKSQGKEEWDLQTWRKVLRHKEVCDDKKDPNFGVEAVHVSSSSLHSKREVLSDVPSNETWHNLQAFDLFICLSIIYLLISREGETSLSVTCSLLWNSTSVTQLISLYQCQEEWKHFQADKDWSKWSQTIQS